MQYPWLTAAAVIHQPLILHIPEGASGVDAERVLEVSEDTRHGAEDVSDETPQEGDTREGGDEDSDDVREETHALLIGSLDITKEELREWGVGTEEHQEREKESQSRPKMLETIFMDWEAF
jgi:hypothetical protein